MCMMEMCSSFICPIFVLCPSTDPVCNKLAVHDRTWVLPFPELRLVHWQGGGALVLLLVQYSVFKVVAIVMHDTNGCACAVFIVLPWGCCLVWYASLCSFCAWAGEQRCLRLCILKDFKLFPRWILRFFKYLVPIIVFSPDDSHTSFVGLF